MTTDCKCGSDCAACRTLALELAASWRNLEFLPPTNLNKKNKE